MSHPALRSLVPSLAALSLSAPAAVAGCSGDSTSSSTTRAAPKPTETAFAAGKPGGSTVEVSLNYQDGISGVKGDLTDGSPVSWALFRAQDWDGLLPRAGTEPCYFRDQVDVQLKTSSDFATFTVSDVTPGDYVATCFMDPIHGGITPGSGDVVNSVTPKVTAVAGKVAHTKAELDFAIP